MRHSKRLSQRRSHSEPGTKSYKKACGYFSVGTAIQLTLINDNK